jgi:hypothetical protein
MNENEAAKLTFRTRSGAYPKGTLGSICDKYCHDSVDAETRCPLKCYCVKGNGPPAADVGLRLLRDTPISLLEEVAG